MSERDTAQEVITDAAVTELVELACRAPSLHNVQPWRWVFADQVLNLFADRSRVEHGIDSTGREVILSCGAALDHLRVAAAGAGWATEVARLVSLGDARHLATIRFRRSDVVTDHDRALRDSILTRRTDRLAFESPEPWNALDGLLRSVIDDSVATLDVIDDDGRPALAEASRRSEANRRDQALYQRELAWWTEFRAADDGIPDDALASAEEAHHVDVARAFPAHGLVNRRPRLDRDHSKVLVLSTYDDGPQRTLQCGELLSRVLLECTVAGFATCTLTHLIEVHDSRELIRTLTGRRAEPQVLIRVGRAPAFDPSPAVTPRRPVAEVFEAVRT